MREHITLTENVSFMCVEIKLNTHLEPALDTNANVHLYFK
jgi:hypothetical protein